MHRGLPDPEEFIPLEQMANTVRATLHMGSYVDSQSIVQPLQVARHAKTPGTIVGPRLAPGIRSDLFVPNEAERQEYMTEEPDGTVITNRVRVTSMGSALYHAVTGRHLLRLGHEDIDSLHSDRASLQQTLSEVGYSSCVNKEQGKDSIRISNPDSRNEFANTRLYIAGAASGPLIVKKMVEHGASFEGAKIWTPDLHTNPQAFRLDTPIIDIENYQQLHASVTALRRISAEEKLILKAPTYLGQRINNLPGVYLAQRDGTLSFNGDMSKMFGPAIQQAGEKVRLRAGDTLTDDAILDIANDARKVAQQQTGRFDRDNGNHAFMTGQDVHSIMDAMNS
ncbi:MAG TPA: hypothetical protein VLA92_02230 [Candidatus Saccharimonadales bacterium]|nr:hypothetical protein [Candidatus Saccharimonadales bacterium]